MPKPRTLQRQPAVKGYQFLPPCDYAMARFPFDVYAESNKNWAVRQEDALKELVRCNPEIPTSEQQLTGHPFVFFRQGHGMPIRIPAHWPDPAAGSWLWVHMTLVDANTGNEGVAYSGPFGW